MNGFQRRKIGDIVTAAGLVKPEQLEEALLKQQESRDRLGRILVIMGLITEDELAQALSDQLHIPRFLPEKMNIPEDVINILAREFIEERQVVPVARRGRLLEMAMVDPLDYNTINEVQFRTGLSVVPLVISSASFEKIFVARYGPRAGDAGDVHEVLRQMQTAEEIQVVVETDEDADDITRLRKAGEAAPVISMVNMVLTDAINLLASDIHIEPRQKDVLVRYRIDGLLREITTLPSYVHQSVISRLKIMAKMDIATHRKPLDGGTKIKMGGREVDLRISTLPTLYGEKMVIRILDKNRQAMGLDSLGMLPRDLDVFAGLLSMPQGMILVTGPTGSGKSTTLYASLLHVRREGVNITTIEDPIEYQIANINQVQVNDRAGISFATGLRSFLRQDPNIIMVGEIRDRQTAEIAFQAAQTGHLVLSTLHTNNAVAAITRLIDIGIEPYLVASSVVGVVAQRLVRKNCPHCLMPYQPKPQVLASFSIDPSEIGENVFVRGQGCPQCQLVGYKGRTGLYELLKMNDDVRELVIERASEKKVLAAARDKGMSTMVEEGLYKSVKKMTTLEEILRVMPPEEARDRKQSSWSRVQEHLAAEGITVTRTRPVEAKIRPKAEKAKKPEPLGVVLAEETPGSLKDLEGMLAKAGYAVRKVATGEEITALPAGDGPFVVISDIFLHNLNIGQLQKLIVEKGTVPDLPLLAAVDNEEMASVVQEFGLEKDRILIRPIKITALKKILKSVQAGKAQKEGPR